MTTPHQEGEEKCQDCKGFGKELCDNPDHGFIDALSFHDIGRIGCPGCGHDRYNRTKNDCESCKGTGKLTPPTTQSWEEKFDEKFGKDGPEKNCDSIGRGAGCDDCSLNIEERAEHKQFVAETLATAEAEWKERLVKAMTDKKEMFEPAYEVADQAYVAALSDIITLINSTK